MRRMIPTLIFFAGLILLACTPVRAQECVDADLVLAIDSSRSVQPDEWDLQMRGYQKAFHDPEVLNAILSGPCKAVAVTAIIWAAQHEQFQIMPWTRIWDVASAGAYGDRLNATEELANNEGTCIYGAILTSLDLLKQSPYPADRMIIDVSGDGVDNTDNSSSIYYLDAARNRADKAGVVINGLPLMYHPSIESVGPYDLRVPLDEYYMRNVIVGPGSFIEPVKSYIDFDRAVVKKLSQELLG